MKWTVQLKRLVGSRFGLCAVLFLLVTAWGAFSVLFGVLSQRSACRGYAHPGQQVQMSRGDRTASYRPPKGDPTSPRRAPGAVPASALQGPAPVTSWGDQWKEKTAKAEAAVTAAMDERHGYIQLFGAFQNLADRTTVEDAASPGYAVSKLKNGSLTFVGQGEPDAAAEAAELKRLQLALADYDIPLLYVQAPSKLEPGEDALPYGVVDTGNACADRLLAALDEVEVDHIDLRETFAAQGRPWEAWFYRTDHHWNQDAAFLAFQDLAAQLERYPQTTAVAQGTKRKNISIPAKYTDPQLFQTTVLPDFFLGSQGKRVGSLYTGTDDFALRTPDFATLLRYQAPANRLDRYGSATETVLFPERVEERDWFSENPYVFYSGGDYGYAHIKNYYNPTGPKVLLIRESFSCALTPYLAYACSEVTTIDPRYFTGTLMSFVAMSKPDVVVILYSAGTTRTERLFRLLPQPAQVSKGDALRWKDDWVAEDKT